MKQLLALLLIVVMGTLCACGTGNASSEKVPVSSKSLSSASYEEESEEETSSELVLTEEDEYVVVCKKGSGKTLSSISDIKGKSVGAVYDSDGERIAEYYGAQVKSCGTESDCFSDLLSGLVEFVISRRIAANNPRVDVVLDPIDIQK